MSDVVIDGIISLAGIIATAYITKSNVIKEIEERIAVIQTKMDQMANDIKEHNNYAKMYSETMPVVREQIKGIKEQIAELKK